MPSQSDPLVPLLTTLTFREIKFAVKFQMIYSVWTPDRVTQNTAFVINVRWFWIPWRCLTQMKKKKGGVNLSVNCMFWTLFTCFAVNFTISFWQNSLTILYFSSALQSDVQRRSHALKSASVSRLYFTTPDYLISKVIQLSFCFYTHAPSELQNFL